jgi:thiamine transporter
MATRFIAHVASGYVLFSGWAEWYFTQEGFPAWGAQLVETLSAEGLGLVYSLVYNGMYMLPEMVIVSLAALLLARAPRIVEKVS